MKNPRCFMGASRFLILILFLPPFLAVESAWSAHPKQNPAIVGLQKRFPSVPPEILKKLEELQKTKEKAEKIKIFEEARKGVDQIEKDFKLDPENKTNLDTLAIYQLQEMLMQVHRQGFQEEGCKKSIRLMPFWADPTLSDIREAHEPARFTYELVQSICR